MRPLKTLNGSITDGHEIKKTSNGQKSKETSDDQETKEISDDQKSKEISDGHENKETSDDQETIGTSDDQKSKDTSDDQENKETSDDPKSKDTSDGHENKETSDDQKTKETSDDQKTKDTSDGHESNEISVDQKTKETSDDPKSKETSDDQKTKDTSDGHGNKETSDDHETKETSDDPKSKDTSDGHENKETSDDHETKETSDDKKSKATSDGQESKEISDDQETKEISDDQKSKETSDGQENKETSDDQETIETSDDQETKEISDDQETKETSDSNSATTTNTKIITSPISEVRIIQNFHLVWLDSNIDEVNDSGSIYTITELQRVASSVKTFIDVDKCIDFITSIEDEKVFMISSGRLGQTLIPTVHDMIQINAIYIFCENKTRHEQWAKDWPKIKGVYTDITTICEALKQATQDCKQNSVSNSFVKTTDRTSNQNLDTLDQSFMYTQILKEILLTINFQQEHINEFLMYCREQFSDNSAELKNVEKIHNEYNQHQPIWWYTYDCFLYSMLNRALRLMDVDLIIKMGFFVRDLHNHIAALHTEQYGAQNHSSFFTVYRSQSVSQADFAQLKMAQGGLLSFNNFLLTNFNREVSLAFAECNQDNPDFIGVLFEINIDTSISSTPFAKVSNVSYDQTDEEILFSMHSIFRIGQFKQINGNKRLWQVDLTLTINTDLELQALTDRIREETGDLPGWYRLGQLMIKLGQLEKAEELYEILLKQTNNEGENAHLFHQLGRVKHNQGKYDEAITFYEKSLEIQQKTLPANHPDLANSYSNIGLVYNDIGEYSKALSYYERSLNIGQGSLPPDHPHLQMMRESIASVKEKL